MFRMFGNPIIISIVYKVLTGNRLISTDIITNLFTVSRRSYHYFGLNGEFKVTNTR